MSTNNKIYNNTLPSSTYSLAPVFSANGPAALPGTQFENNIFTTPLPATPGAVVQNNVLAGTDPKFIDPASHNYQLQPASPSIAAGLAVPPYTNAFIGSAPDIGAYDHTRPPWKAGVQNVAIISAPSYAPTLTPGTIAVVTGSVPFDSSASVVLTDGANVDWPVSPTYVVASSPQLAFQVPAAASPGVAMITITNGDGSISLSSAPVFAGSPPINVAVTQGSGQSAPVETLFSTLLQARVTDSNGNAVPNASVTFAAPATGAGGTFGLPATVATNTSGIAVAPPFTANAVAGTYTITASAAGAGALAVFDMTNSGVSLLSQTITFGPLGNQTLGPPARLLNATASSGLAVTFVSNAPSVCTVSGATVTLVAGGTCAITANQPGNATYAAAASVVQAFAVYGATAQTITFGALNNMSEAVDPFTIGATASSGLPVSFASTTPSICTVLGTTVTILSTGICSITASQGGNSTYEASPSVTQAFAVSEPLPAGVGPILTGIANAASASQAVPSVVSPGSYVAIYGTGMAGNGNPSASLLPLPTSLNEVQASLGGMPMPLLYAASGQINALVPNGLTPNNSYPLVVATVAIQSAPAMLLVKELQPGIYTVSTSGSGSGIVANAATGQLVNGSNPAHAGDYLVIYCTGLGPVQGPNGEAPPVDGAAAPSDVTYSTVARVTATIGGLSAPVSFSGLTPTLVELYQVNVQVPAGIAAGSSVPLVISATDSQTGATAQSNSVTIAVQ